MRAVEDDPSNWSQLPGEDQMEFLIPVFSLTQPRLSAASWGVDSQIEDLYFSLHFQTSKSSFACERLIHLGRENLGFPSIYTPEI